MNIMNMNNSAPKPKLSIRTQSKSLKTQPNNVLSNRYSLALSEPGYLQKIVNYKPRQSNQYYPIFVQNSNRYLQLTNHSHPTPARNKPSPHIQPPAMYIQSAHSAQNEKQGHSKDQHPEDQSMGYSDPDKPSTKLKKLMESKLREAYETNQANSRAKQFVKMVNEQKSRLRGRLFVLRQQELEKKNIKQQIESLEKTYIKFHYMERRRSQAQAHIQLLTRKAMQRSPHPSRSHLRKHTPNNPKKSSLQNRREGQSPNSRKAVDQNGKSRTKRQGFQQSQLSIEQDLDQVRMKLIQLNKLMKKQQHFKKPEYDNY